MESTPQFPSHNIVHLQDIVRKKKSPTSRRSVSHPQQILGIVLAFSCENNSPFPLFSTCLEIDTFHAMASNSTVRSLSAALPRSYTSRLFPSVCRYFSLSPAYNSPVGTNYTADRPTSFGFKTVTESEKQQRVAGVFSSVAESYDRMNDLMSMGVHRLWKSVSISLHQTAQLLLANFIHRDHFVNSLNPGYFPPGQTPKSQHILDVAGGTGDIAFRHLRTAHVLNGNPEVRVTISDINPDMLEVGYKRSTSLPAGQQAAVSFLEANAEDLTDKVADNSVDLYTVAFGIRNFSNMPAALREAYRVLKPGGVFACLEFSKVGNPLLNMVYKRWSFGAIPLIGQLVAADRDSYQYLVESIEQFPSQEEFRQLILDGGFHVAGQGWENLTGGIAAIHKGIKPLE